MSNPAATRNGLWRKVKNRLRPLKRRLVGPAKARVASGSIAGAAAGELPPEIAKKIQALADYRKEPFEKALVHAVNHVGLKDVPASYKWYYLPENWSFQTLAVEGAFYATIALENGRVLTGYRSDSRFQRYYRCLFDKLPAGVTAETYEVYVESWRRYDRTLAARSPFLPKRGQGGCMVDAGSYIGFKGLGYADYMGPKGRVLMIDIDPVSDAVARRNVEQNGLADRVQAVCCAILDKDYTPPAGAPVRKTFDRVRNTLARIDEHPTWTVSNVATRSLDSLFREAGLDEIDYLNMQLNGAEYEALDGLVDYWDRTKVIYCAASFHTGGASLNERLVRRFTERGCHVRTTRDSVLAVTPRHRRSFGV